jgi:hypothetical protein
VIERNRQRVGVWNLVRAGAGRGASCDQKAKKDRRDSHDASIKRDERSSVNRRQRSRLNGVVIKLRCD